MQKNDPDYTRVVNHALVFGSGESVSSDTTISTKSGKPHDSTVSQVSTQGYQVLEFSCVAPRATIINNQGFSDQVAARIEASQRLTSSNIIESK